MSQLNIDIDTANDDFQQGNETREIVRILREYCTHIERTGDLTRNLQDLNGSTVGWAVYRDGEA